MKSVTPNTNEQSNFNGMGRDMAERLGLGPEIKELKLGPTFTGGKSTAFHSIKYDFKPASVDVSKMATVDVSPNNTMTVTVPHLDGAGIPHTVFKGSQRPYSKECVLIIDKITGEITLEKLSSNIQVKKTRVEHKSQSHLNVNNSGNNNSNRPTTPIENKKSPTEARSSGRPKIISGKKKEPSFQLHPKPSSHQNSAKVSPFPAKSSPNRSPARHSSQSLGSLPMIGSDFDDFHIPSTAPPIPSRNSATNERISSANSLTTATTTTTSKDNDVGFLSESSSSSSSSDSSDSDSEPDKHPVPPANGHANANNSSPLLMNMPDNLLNDDLQLSESESDND